jgi:hypothetical protein
MKKKPRLTQRYQQNVSIWISYPDFHHCQSSYIDTKVRCRNNFGKMCLHLNYVSCLKVKTVLSLPTQKEKKTIFGLKREVISNHAHQRRRSRARARWWPRQVGNWPISAIGLTNHARARRDPMISHDPPIKMMARVLFLMTEWLQKDWAMDWG